MFDAVLSLEHRSAHNLAYDRPSGNLFAFLKKHYGLQKYERQSNNFVIFEEYFRGSKATYNPNSDVVSERIQKNGQGKFISDIIDVKDTLSEYSMPQTDSYTQGSVSRY